MNSNPRKSTITIAAGVLIIGAAIAIYNYQAPAETPPSVSAPPPSVAKRPSARTPLPVIRPREVPKPKLTAPNLTPEQRAALPKVTPEEMRRRTAWLELTDQERRDLAMWRVEETARRGNKSNADQSKFVPVSHDEVVDRALALIDNRNR